MGLLIFLFMACCSVLALIVTGAAWLALWIGAKVLDAAMPGFTERRREQRGVAAWQLRQIEANDQAIVDWLARNAR